MNLFFRNYRLIVTVMVLTLFNVTTLLGGEYHIDPENGNDVNSGSLKSPWKTINKALTKLQPGTTFLLHKGIYNGPFWIKKGGGTAGKPITFKRYKQDRVIIKSANNGFALRGENPSYFVFDGLRFESCRANGIVAYGDYITIRNCTFVEVRDSAVKSNDMKRRHRNLLIENCTFQDPLRDIAIFTDNIDGHIIRNCRFLNSGKRGEWPFMDPGGISNMVIENNLFFYPGNERGPLKIRVGNAERFDAAGKVVNCNGGIVRNNIFAGSPKYAILIASSNGVMVYNNTLVHLADQNGVQTGLLYIQRDAVDLDNKALSPNRHNVFKNNIFYLKSRDRGAANWFGSGLVSMHRNMSSGAKMTPPAKAADEYKMQEFENNLYYKSPGKEYIHLLGKYLTADKVKGWGNGYDQKSLIGKKPGFLKLRFSPDPAGYRLRPNSPCVDAGCTLTVTVGKGKGKTIRVKDARYFTNGRGMVTGDRIKIGKNKLVKVVARDIEKHTLTVAKVVSWKSGDPVSLDYRGKAPDIGTYEAGLDYPVGKGSN